MKETPPNIGKKVVQVGQNDGQIAIRAKETSAQIMAAKLPATTNLDHHSMPSDLSCLRTFAKVDDVFSGETDLFGSHWFDKIQVHGADLMFSLGAMFERILAEGETLSEITASTSSDQ